MFQKQKKIMATLSATSSSISACLASIVSNSVILATWLLEHIFWADFTLKEDLVKEILTWGSSPLMYIPSSIWSRSPHGKQGDEEGGKVCEYNLKIKKWKLKEMNKDTAFPCLCLCLCSQQQPADVTHFHFLRLSINPSFSYNHHLKAHTSQISSSTSTWNFFRQW